VSRTSIAADGLYSTTAILATLNTAWWHSQQGGEFEPLRGTLIRRQPNRASLTLTADRDGKGRRRAANEKTIGPAVLG